MRLSDIMSPMGLWGWAVAAMVLFVAVYAGQVWSVFSARNRELMTRAGSLPLADDLTLPPAQAQGTAETPEVQR
jgi:cbb3-type cytochrome oxidase subunit 3